MQSGATLERSDVRAALADLCARNTTAEVHYGRGDDIQTARVRLLMLGEDVVCTDQPQNLESGVALHSGVSVRVFFSRGNERYVFDSRVVSLRRRVRLNAQHCVLGMALAIPASIRAEQRRRDFRVSLASQVVTCTATPESLEFEGACDLAAPILHGQLANVSARGAGVIFPDSVKHLVIAGGRVFLAFFLPGEEEEFLVQADVRHVRPIPGRDTVIAGLRIALHEALGGLQTRSRLARFVVSEQRRKLRRRR
ncbi:MAG TPA: PilZ domain-containing protein [Phycisphaerae bacterium]|nr:PilZ domain-containing protein [Phycisphaerales bacterium]HRX85110.1 PilZ domain-containing protein [Phycisphaerae bacterium]